MGEDYNKKDNNLFYIISDFLDSLVVILDESGKIIYYNEASKNITGISVDNVKGKSYWDIFCLPEERELYKSFFEMLEKKQFPFEIETKLLDSEGYFRTITWKYNILEANVLCEIIETKEEQKDYYILSGTDLTKHIEDKKELQELGEKYRAILHASPVSVISTDTKFQIRSWSAAAENLLGWPERTVLDRSIFSFLHDPTQILFEYCQKALKGKITRDLEIKCFCKNGKELYVNVSLAPTRDYRGKIDGMVMVVFDITEKKEAEEKIRYLSFHDSLTGLYNRHYLEEEMKRLDTQRQLPIGIIMADLNGLKLVNDTYGHGAGDEMLKEAANILKKSCRSEDILGRWGGDEFIIFLPQISKVNLEKIVERINENCRSVQVNDIPLSLALGSVIKDTPGKKLAKILQEAENNMYESKLVESKTTKNAIMISLLRTLRENTFESQEHTRRMKIVASQISEKIGFSREELERLKQFIILHDIGMINVSVEILSKKGSLSEEEWETIKKHPETGYRIVRAVEEFSYVAEEILSHHEHYDGGGYPRKLKGEEIPLLSRITAVADAYEVMSSGRPYKEVLSSEQIVEEFQRCSGSQFDPYIVDIFLELYSKGFFD